MFSYHYLYLIYLNRFLVLLLSSTRFIKLKIMSNFSNVKKYRILKLLLSFLKIALPLEVNIAWFFATFNTILIDVFSG